MDRPWGKRALGAQAGDHFRARPGRVRVRKDSGVGESLPETVEEEVTELSGGIGDLVDQEVEEVAEDRPQEPEV